MRQSACATIVLWHLFALLWCAAALAADDAHILTLPVPVAYQELNTATASAGAVVYKAMPANVPSGVIAEAESANVNFGANGGYAMTPGGGVVLQRPQRLVLPVTLEHAGAYTTWYLARMAVNSQKRLQENVGKTALQEIDVTAQFAQDTWGQWVWIHGQTYTLDAGKTYLVAEFAGAVAIDRIALLDAQLSPAQVAALPMPVPAVTPGSAVADIALPPGFMRWADLAADLHERPGLRFEVYAPDAQTWKPFDPQHPPTGAFRVRITLTPSQQNPVPVCPLAVHYVPQHAAGGVITYDGFETLDAGTVIKPGSPAGKWTGHGGYPGLAMVVQSAESADRGKQYLNVLGGKLLPEAHCRAMKIEEGAKEGALVTHFAWDHARDPQRFHGAHLLLRVRVRGTGYLMPYLYADKGGNPHALYMVVDAPDWVTVTWPYTVNLPNATALLHVAWHYVTYDDAGLDLDEVEVIDLDAVKGEVR
jgi:hypothetical protein